MAAFNMSITEVIVCYAYAAIIFAGPLSIHVMQGFNLMIISSIVGCVVLACFSSFSIATATLEEAALALYALISLIIASKIKLMPNAIDPAYTIYATMVIITIATGFLMWIFGKLKWGNIIRFIPFPVIAAFLAATGFLLVFLSGKLLIGEDFSFSQVSSLNLKESLPLILSCSIAFIIFLMLERVNSSILYATSLLLTLIVFYLSIWFFDLPLNQFEEAGWFIQTAKGNASSNTFQLFSLDKIQWNSLLDWDILGNVLAILLIAPLALLFEAGSIEVETKHEFDFNRELKYSGIANVILPIFGGSALVSMYSGDTIQTYHIGAKTRLVGIFSACFCATSLWFGTALFNKIPLFIILSIPISMGFDLMKNWLIQPIKTLPILDVLLLWLIFLLITVKGFLVGITLGFVASLIFFDYRYSKINVVRAVLNGSDLHSNIERGLAEEAILRPLRKNIEIVLLQGYLFFGNINTLIERLIKRIKVIDALKPNYILLDFRNMQGMDTSSIESFYRLYHHAKQKNIRVVFTHLPNKLYEGILLALKFPVENDFCIAFENLDYGLEWCEDQLLQSTSLNWKRRFTGQIMTIFPLEEQLKIFLSFLEMIEVTKGQIIFSETDVLTDCYFLEYGTLELMYTDQNKNIRRAKRVCSGIFVGAESLYLNFSQPFSCKAESDCILYRLSFEKLIDFETKYPSLANVIHRFIINQLISQQSNSLRTMIAFT